MQSIGTLDKLSVSKLEKIKVALIDELKNRNKYKSKSKIKVTVMPHFCVDVFVLGDDDFTLCDENCESFTCSFKEVANRSGGNIPIKEQKLSIGGKAANCASALSSIGCDVSLIAKTDKLGLILLEHFFENKKIDLAHVKTDGKLASTCALELKEANVMLSDAGSLTQFGPKYLNDEDIELIESSDYVCLSDWALNMKGTQIAEHVFKIAKKIKDFECKTFFDPGDPSFRKDEEIKGLVDKVIKKKLVDMLSVNEDEVIRYGSKISESNSILQSGSNLKELTRVDLHTKDGDCSFGKLRDTAFIPSFKCKPKRLTGAGDSWNAGDIYGDAISLSDEGRLMLSNAVAAYYISNEVHPSKEDLIKFLERATFNNF